MRHSGRISPGPRWESLRAPSSEADISDHEPRETSQNTPRKRKSDAISSQSRQNSAKSRRLNPQSTPQGRVTTSVPSSSAPVTKAEASRTNNLGERRRITQGLSSPTPNSTSPRRTHNSNTTNQAPTTSSNGSSKILQHLSLTQPVFSAKTRIKRNKPAAVTPSSRSSSELPETILGDAKTVKPLLLAADRKKRGAQSLSIAKPIILGGKKAVPIASPKRATPKQFIGDTIEISSDDDPPKISRPIQSARRTSPDILIISSDDELVKASIPANVSPKTAKPKSKPTKTSSPQSNLRSAVPVVDENRISITKAGAVSLSTGPRLWPIASAGSAQVSPILSATVPCPKPSLPAVLTHQCHDVDMLEADPLDFFADSSGNFDAPSAIGVTTDVNSEEHSLQAAQPDIQISPTPDLPVPDHLAGITMDKSACNTTVAAFVDSYLNGATAPRDLAAINDYSVQTDPTPGEAEVAMFDPAADGKALKDVGPSSSPVSMQSSIPSPTTASGVPNHQKSSPPARSKPPNPVTSDPFPMTEGVWGYARRRIQRQTPNTGAAPRLPGPMMACAAKASFGKEFPSSSKYSERSSDSTTLLSKVATGSDSSCSQSFLPSASNDTSRRSSSLANEGIAMLYNKDASETGIITSSTTPTLSQSAKSPNSRNLTDVINHAREEYLLRTSSKSPEVSSPQPRQSSHSEDGGESRRQRSGNTINKVDKSAESIPNSTLPSATPESNRDSPTHSNGTPCSDLTREMSTLHLTACSAQGYACELLAGVEDAGNLYPDTDAAAPVDDARVTASQVFDGNSEISISDHPAEVFESLAETSDSVNSLDKNTSKLESTQIDDGTITLEKTHSQTPVDILVDVPESPVIKDMAPTPAEVIAGMQTGDASANNADNAAVGLARHLVHTALPSSGRSTPLQLEHTRDVTTSAASTLPPTLDPLETDSDGEILMYPEDEELSATSSNEQLSTKVLRTREYLQDLFSGSSKTPSLPSSRLISPSCSSSSDPINLIEKPDALFGGKTSQREQSQSKNLHVITWPDIRAATRRLKPKHLLAKDLPHSLQDNMNAMDPYFRSLPMARTIFEAAISENTMDDEPDAPPIKIINDIDDEPTPPWEFYYTNQMWHGEGVPGPDIENLPSCDCEGSCDPKSAACVCLNRQQKLTSEYTPDFAYDRRGRLRQNDIPIFECNDLCGCGEECRNRVVQHGRKCIVYIGKTREKGWGVFAGPKKIPSGTYVGIYSGELLTDAESEMRGLTYNSCGRTYLFDIDHHHLRNAAGDNWETKYVVDAYHAGNFTRFLNHSCDPNCALNACYINDANIEKPLLAVFTSRDIEPGEELCFSYFGTPDTEAEEGEDDQTIVASRPKDAVDIPCRCGAANCTGIMFT